MAWCSLDPRPFGLTGHGGARPRGYLLEVRLSQNLDELLLGSLPHQAHVQPPAHQVHATHLYVFYFSRLDSSSSAKWLIT